jgi:hypothetical protein
MADSRAVRPREAKVLIERSMKAGRPLFLWGPPGIGKSDIIAQIGADQKRPVIDIRLLLCDPTDIKGIPYFDSNEGTMKWAPSNELPKHGQGLDNAILFLDEMNSAPPSVQGAAYQLILNRRIGEYVLPEGVSIIAAGNRDTDKGVTFRMPTPLANRFVHLEIEHNFEDWQRWAVNVGVNADVVGFLSHHKQKLFMFDPKSTDKAFATPRSWVFVSELIDPKLGDLPESMVSSLVKGTVGEGLAIEFMAHRRVAAKMPKPDDVLAGKVKKLDVQDISAKYSLTIAMCYTLKEYLKNANDVEDKSMDIKTWNTAVDFFFRFMMDNFEAEMVILGAKTALRDYQLPINHRELKNFNEFYEKYGKYVMED